MPNFRRNSASSRSNETTSDNETSLTSESSDSSGTDDDSTTGHNGSRVKNFFKNLFAKRDLTQKTAKKEECIQMQDKTSSGKQHQHRLSLQEKLVQQTDSAGSIESPTAKSLNEHKNNLHPFLTIDNKDPSKFHEYKSKLIKTSEEFRSLYNEAILKGNFSSLVDFFCWTFSQSSNLIDLLGTEKQINSNKQNEPESSSNSKKVDASYYVTPNWRFMKEVYICLAKMVYKLKIFSSYF